MTKNEVWSGLREFPIVGHYFKLLNTVNNVDVKLFGQNGEVLASELAISAGYWVSRRGLAPFVRIEITTGAAESVKFLVTDGESGSDQASRQWYDRTPATKGKSYGASGVAPHVATQRWTYTVPANRKAMLESAQIVQMRETAAGPVGRSSSYIATTTSDAVSAVAAYAVMILNAVGNPIADSKPLQAVLIAGDVVSGNTEDLSTGGTVFYQCNAKLTEYDA